MRSWLTLTLLAMLLVGCSSRRSPQQKIPRIGHRETGEASWYGEPYHGRRAANGEIYDMEKLTAAHRTYAFDTWLRVVNLSNDKSVVVRVIDRGPFAHHRIIDLSRAAAREIDLLQSGVAKVRLEVVRPPTVESVRALTSDEPRQKPITARFTLQAGAFREEVNAQALAERLHAMTSDVTVVLDERTSIWKVHAGIFTNPSESEELASRLRKEGVDTFVVELAR